MTRISIILLQASSLLAMTTAAPAFAQTADAGVSSNEILVTARRREESLQDVPVSVAAFDRSAIERYDLSDFDDIARRTPNFSFSKNLGVNGGVPVIRGVGAPRTGGAQAVGVFIDGIDTGNGEGANLQSFDVERIEVVRGPQSTQFGRAVLAGAINFVSRRPNLEKIEAEALGEIAEFGMYRLEGRVSGPVTDDFAVSFAAQRRAMDGPYTNNLTGRPAGGMESTIFVGGARAKFGSDKQGEAFLRVSYNNENYGPVAWHQVATNTQTGAAANQRWFIGRLTGDPAKVSHNGDNYRNFDIEGVRVNFLLDYDFGGAVLQSLSNYSNQTQILDNDGDYTSAPGFVSGPQLLGDFRNYLVTDIESYSQELRLTSDTDSKFFWMVGAYIRKENFDRDELSPTAATGSVLILNTVPNRLNRDVRTLGLFGAAGIELLPGLKITQELRYSEDKIDELAIPRSPIPGRETSFSANFTNWLPRTIVEFAATPSHLLYASVAKGSKPGGFNNSAGAGLAPVPDNLKFFDEEQMWAYEAGFKTSWLDNRLTINAAVFYLDWSNIQVNSQVVVDPTLPPVGLTLAGGAADGFGFEAEFQFRPVKMFEVYGGIGYSPVRIINFTDTRVAAAGLRPPPRAQIAGSTDWTGNFGAVLNVPLSEKAEGFLQGDLTYRSNTFATEANLASTGPQTLVSMQVGFTSGPFRVTGYVNNLFDNKAIDSTRAFVNPTTFARSFIVQLPDPRQFGVRFAVRY